jgi:hypothetical protein
MKLSIYIFLAILLITVSSSAQTGEKAVDTGIKPVPEKIKLSDDDRVNKALFDRIIKDHPENTRVYYFSVEGEKDPGDAFLALFSDLNVTLKKGSEAPLFGYLDIRSDPPKREPGPLYWISKLTWISKDEVSASAGITWGNMGGDWCKYILKRDGGEWKIISVSDCAVS